MTPLLEVALTVDYPARPGVLRDFRMQVGPGEIFGLAGQSGSGKSTFTLAILGLLGDKRAKVSGSVRFAGQEILRLNDKALRGIRGRQIALVPQSPLASLNPSLRIGTHFEEAWSIHRQDSRGTWRQESIAALRAASLAAPEDLLRRYPRHLSVGMAQRVLIALALLHRPKLIIADEATSALDLITQSEILQLFRDLRRDYGVSVLFITHDLNAAAGVCDRMAILHEGQIAETGATSQVLHHPVHPYTRRLVSALPVIAELKTA